MKKKQWLLLSTAALAGAVILLVWWKKKQGHRVPQLNIKNPGEQSEFPSQADESELER